MWWAAVGAAALAGLALRMLAAQGGLWTDEAWSVILAQQARDPAGVFLRINHDNNHHLYSLWLQAIGANASPFLARLPAIVAGTAAIPLVARLLGRWSRMAGAVGAWLFALSPAFVTFGSEARGYALMIFATLVMITLAVGDQPDKPLRARPWWLALTALLGMLSHLTMAAAVALTYLWIHLDRRRALGPRGGAVAALRLMGPALVATALVAAFVIAAAMMSPVGPRLGGYLPFAIGDFAGALDELIGMAVGLTFAQHWVAPLVVGGAAIWAAFAPPPWLGKRGLLYALLIVGIPLGAGLVQPGNAGFARYYLLSGIGLSLLASEWLGYGLSRPGAVRVAAAGAGVVLTAAMMLGDCRLVAMERGRPAGAFEAIAAARPSGARVALDPKRLEAILDLPARRAGYPLVLAKDCEPADFVLSAPPRWAPVPAQFVRCGESLVLVASAQTSPLTGDTWALYRSRSLPIG